MTTHDKASNLKEQPTTFSNQRQGESVENGGRSEMHGTNILQEIDKRPLPAQLDLGRKKRARNLLPTKKTETAIARRTKKARSQEKKDRKQSTEKPSMSHFCTTFKSRPTKTSQDLPAKERNQSKTQQKSTADDKQDSTPAGPAVQIVDGEIVLQESSMILHGNVKPPTEDDEEYQVVEEEDQLGGIGSTYTSFSKKRNISVRWTAQETEIFYKALRQVGTDFTTMESFFDGRTQKTLKRKYKFEMTKNPALVEAALNPSARKNVDLSVFEVTDSDLANIKQPVPPADLGPTPVEGKESTSGEDTQKTTSQKEVVEEDADDERQQVLEETEVVPQQQKVSALVDSFWNNDSHAQESTERSKAGTTDEIDAALHEETADATAAEEATPSISLSVLRATAPKKKPKFKAQKSRRKGKGK